MDERAFKDGQVWEKDGLLLQINEAEGKYLVAAFRETCIGLTYAGSVIFVDEKSLRSHIERKGMEPTDKVITLCRKAN